MAQNPLNPVELTQFDVLLFIATGRAWMRHSLTGLLLTSSFIYFLLYCTFLAVRFFLLKLRCSCIVCASACIYSLLLWLFPGNVCCCLLPFTDCYDYFQGMRAVIRCYSRPAVTGNEVAGCRTTCAEWNALSHRRLRQLVITSSTCDRLISLS